MQSHVLQYFQELSTDSRLRVSKHFQLEIAEFARLTGRLIAILQRFHAHHPAHDADSTQDVAFALMTKGANTFTAGFELTITGYIGESEVLLRSALERFAVAWDLVSSTDRFETWKSGKKFDSTESISRLKREIEPIGRLYGYLSNEHVHVSPRNNFPSMTFVGGHPKLQLFGYLSPGNEHLPKGAVYSSLFLAYLLLQLTEIVFHGYCEDFETIERRPADNFVTPKVTQRHRLFVDAGTEYFKVVAADPQKAFAPNREASG